MVGSVPLPTAGVHTPDLVPGVHVKGRPVLGQFGCLGGSVLCSPKGLASLETVPCSPGATRRSSASGALQGGAGPSSRSGVSYPGPGATGLCEVVGAERGWRGAVAPVADARPHARFPPQ